MRNAVGLAILLAASAGGCKPKPTEALDVPASATARPPTPASAEHAVHETAVVVTVAGRATTMRHALARELDPSLLELVLAPTPLTCATPSSYDDHLMVRLHRSLAPD